LGTARADADISGAEPACDTPMPEKVEKRCLRDDVS